MSSARDFARVVVADTFGKPFNGVVDAALSAVGVPADAGEGDARMAFTLLRLARLGWRVALDEIDHGEGFPVEHCAHAERWQFGRMTTASGRGTSEAAAVAALLARMEESGDA